MYKLLRKSGVAVVGFVIIAVVSTVAIFAPFAAPKDPYKMNPLARRAAPSTQYLMGTDHFGRDIASRVILGARVSLWVGVVSVGLAVALGIPLGIVAGYVGGQVDNMIMRALDILFAFPPILLAIVIASVLGPGMTNAMIAIGIVYAPRMARIVRGPVLTVRELEFVQAATALGAPVYRILLKQILPNIMAPVMVQVSLNMSTAILAEAALSFLGLGAQPPMPSWGSMLSEGRVMLEVAPWLSVFPGLAIMVTVLGFNLLGDGLRDSLDPRLRNA